MRRIAFLLAVLASTFAGADSYKVVLSLADKPIGSETWDLKSDGTFESVTQLDVANQKIHSRLYGKLEKERVVSYGLDLLANLQKVELTWDGTTIKAKVNGNATPDRPLSHPSGIGFANYHFQLLRTLFPTYDSATGGRQTVDALMMENGVTAKIAITRTGTTQVTIAGKPVGITRWNVDVGTVQIRVVQATDGRVLGIHVPGQQFKGVVEGYEEVFVDPTTNMPELSQPTFAPVTEKGTKMPMRDGKNLVAEIIRPQGEGKFPVILSRTPYGRIGVAAAGEWWARRGYVFVAQDCRGRGESEGDWVPFENERKDGYDTIDWIAKQPWCDGNVGMIGASYGGLVQWAAAVEKHPALKCIIPQVSPPDAFFNIPYDHGIFLLYGNTWWAGIVREKDAQIGGLAIPNVQALKTLPLELVDDKVWGKNIPFYDSWIQREKPSDYPGFNYRKEIEKVRIPVLMISGWFDGDGIGTKLNWEAQRKGGNPNRWLIYGPWSHAFNSSTAIGNTDFGPDSVLELDSVYLRFFDTWLKSKEANLRALPRVQAFVMGANRWQSMDDWPATNSIEKTYYLSTSGPANGKTSLGELIDALPKEQEPSRYTYNPANAEIPKELVNVDPASATFEVKPEDVKDDVLLFQTEPMPSAMEIGGPIRAELFFSTSAKDTDFFVSLVAIDEKGKITLLGMPGKIRTKYLSGWDNPKLLTPGRTYKATIELWDTSHRFEKGQRLALLVNSTQFPMFARNLNTGEPNFGATRMVAAHQTIYHDPKRPSSLKFRVLPK